MKFNLNNLTYEKYFSYDLNLLEIVYKFSETYNLELNFLGSSPDKIKTNNEKIFF